MPSNFQKEFEPQGKRYRPPSYIQDAKAAPYVEWIINIKPNVFLTLKVERKNTYNAFKKNLDHWDNHCNRAIWRMSAIQAGSKAFPMVGFIEPSDDDPEVLHAHIPVRVPEAYLDRFLKVARKKWERFSRAHTFHSRPFHQTDQDQLDGARYVNKYNDLDLIWWAPLRNYSAPIGAADSAPGGQDIAHHRTIDLSGILAHRLYPDGLPFPLQPRPATSGEPAIPATKTSCTSVNTERKTVRNNSSPKPISVTYRRCRASGLLLPDSELLI